MSEAESNESLDKTSLESPAWKIRPQCDQPPNKPIDLAEPQPPPINLPTEAKRCCVLDDNAISAYDFKDGPANNPLRWKIIVFAGL